MGSVSYTHKAVRHLSVGIVQGNGVLRPASRGVYLGNGVARLGSGLGGLQAGIVAVGSLGVGGALQLSLDAVSQIVLVDGLGKVTAGDLDAALCSLCGPAGRLNGTELSLIHI